MIVKYKNRKLNIPAQKTSKIGKILGLMFKSRNSQNLLFEFSASEPRAIHSFFVFFSFLALWLDEKNNVVDFAIIKPFTFIAKPKKRCVKLIEIPFNVKNKKVINFFRHI